MHSILIRFFKKFILYFIFTLFLFVFVVLLNCILKSSVFFFSFSFFLFYFILSFCLLCVLFVCFYSFNFGIFLMSIYFVIGNILEFLYCSILLIQEKFAVFVNFYSVYWCVFVYGFWILYHCGIVLFLCQGNYWCENLANLYTCCVLND